MNKQNLIRLGSICQKKFDMSDDYRYIELLSDNIQKTYRIPIPNKQEWCGVTITSFFVEEIQLEQIVLNNNETVLVGYGKLSNTLLIQEIEK